MLTHARPVVAAILVASAASTLGAQAERRQPITISAAPQGVTVQASNDGAVISWQAVAVPRLAAFRVARIGGDGQAQVVAELPLGTTTWTDRGPRVAARYYVVSVLSDGRQFPSATVDHAPPPVAARFLPPGTVRIRPGSPGLSAGDVAATPASLTALMAPRRPAATPIAVAGDTVQLQGAGLSGVDRIVLRAADGTETPARIVTQSASALSFVAAAPTPAGAAARYTVAISGRSGSATAPATLTLWGSVPIPRVTGIDRAWGRAGETVTITGEHLATIDGFHQSVSAVYVGSAPPGDPANPAIVPTNVEPTRVRFVVPGGCQREGRVQVAAPQGAGGAVLSHTAPPIAFMCMGATPVATIPDTENGRVPQFQPGERVVLRGWGLSAVTVVRRSDSGAPLVARYLGSTGTEQSLEVTMPPVGALLQRFQFRLEVGGPPSVLLPPWVEVRGPAWVTGMFPWWGEAGTRMKLTGRALSFGAAPRVMVGGVPAQITRFTETETEFVIPAGATIASITHTNEYGTAAVAPPRPPIGDNVLHPGFFLVDGPSVIESAVGDRTFQSTLVLRGRNLARLTGICVLSTTNTWEQMRRVEYRAPHPDRPDWHGLIASNTEMQVFVIVQDQNKPFYAGRPIGLATPSGCVPNPVPLTF